MYRRVEFCSRIAKLERSILIALQPVGGGWFRNVEWWKLGGGKGMAMRGRERPGGRRR